MTTMTPEDAIRAASSLARDVADGKVSPADLEAHAATELRALLGTVVGEGDVAWPVQLDVARQVLAVGGIPATELAEWLAVERHRAGEPVSVPDLDETTPEPESPASSTLSADSEHVEAEPIAEPEPVAEVEPPRRADGYDPLRGWSPGRTRRPL